MTGEYTHSYTHKVKERAYQDAKEEKGNGQTFARLVLDDSGKRDTPLDGRRSRVGSMMTRPTWIRASIGFRHGGEGQEAKGLQKSICAYDCNDRGCSEQWTGRQPRQSVLVPPCIYAQSHVQSMAPNPNLRDLSDMGPSCIMHTFFKTAASVCD